MVVTHSCSLLFDCCPTLSVFRVCATHSSKQTCVHVTEVLITVNVWIARHIQKVRHLIAMETVHFYILTQLFCVEIKTNWVLPATCDILHRTARAFSFQTIQHLLWDANKINRHKMHVPNLLWNSLFTYCDIILFNNKTWMTMTMPLNFKVKISCTLKAHISQSLLKRQEVFPISQMTAKVR